MFLEFGHSGRVEAHGNTCGPRCVTHFPQHTTPLLLVFLIPTERKTTNSTGEDINEDKNSQKNIPLSSSFKIKKSSYLSITKCEIDWGKDLQPDVSDL